MIAPASSATMPKRNSISCAARLLTVAVALSSTNTLFGIYRRKNGPITMRSRYQSPATLPGLRVKVMFPPAVNTRILGVLPTFADAKTRPAQLGSGQRPTPGLFDFRTMGRQCLPATTLLFSSHAANDSSGTMLPFDHCVVAFFET